MNSESSIDEALWRDIAAGKMAAFSEFHARHQGHLIAFVTARVRLIPGISPEDIVQSVWLQVWKRRQFIKPQNVRGLLFKIARDAWVDEMRKRMITGAISDLIDPGSDSGDDQLADLHDCLEALDGKYATVIRAMWRGQSAAEIATQVGIDVNTVYSRNSRARDKLRECLEKKKMGT